jgi:hypothetical protein
VVGFKLLLLFGNRLGSKLGSIDVFGYEVGIEFGFVLGNKLVLSIG